MQINYIILTHRSPTQLERLIQRLKTPEVRFYVHIDLKTDIAPFLFLQKEKVVFLKNRVDVIWGDYSIVKATLNAMKTIVEDKREGYTVVLSGQDYPIKSNTEIQDFFIQNQGFDFIEYGKITDVWSEETYQKRAIAQKINISSNRADFVLLQSFQDTRSIRDLVFNFKQSLKFFYKMPFKRYNEIFCIFKKRKLPSKELYGGAAWWALRTETVSKILKYIETTPDFEKYYKNFLFPDESFFQTILNSLEDYDKQIKGYITYVNWERKGCDLPVTFKDEADFEELKLIKSKLFARKFQENSEVLDKIDVSILEK